MGNLWGQNTDELFCTESDWVWLRLDWTLLQRYLPLLSTRLKHDLWLKGKCYKFDSNLNPLPYMTSIQVITDASLLLAIWISIGYFWVLMNQWYYVTYELHRNCRTLNFKLCLEWESEWGKIVWMHQSFGETQYSQSFMQSCKPESYV